VLERQSKDRFCGLTVKNLGSDSTDIFNRDLTVQC